jgi:HEAT repeat protein
VRTFADDCPLDAGNRKVYWLDGVAAADSVKYLQTLISLTEQTGTPNDIRKRLNSGAISAIGQHRDGAVDALITLAKQNQDTSARSSAFNSLGRSKDPKAVAFIDSILKK